MTIKVTGPTGAGRTDKGKKTTKTTAADRAHFTSLLDAIMGTQAPVAAESVEHTTNEGRAASSYVPVDPQERSAWVIRKLEELYADVLSGNPTLAAAELREALQTLVHNRESLPQNVQTLLKELDIRSAVEIAKLEVQTPSSEK